MELGNKAYHDTNGNWPQPGWGLVNTGPFENLRRDNSYWTGTEYSLYPSVAFDFCTNNGSLGNAYKVQPLYALAVREGAPGPVVTTASSYTTNYMTLGDTFSFDTWWQMGQEPTSLNFDVLIFRNGQWNFVGGDVNTGGSSTQWETLTFDVPEWAQGTQTQIKFVLADFGQETDPTVYLRNVSTGAVPEPSTILLFGAGLIGLGFLRRKYNR